MAFVVLKKGYEPSSELREELRKHVRASIGPVVEPSTVFFVSKVPKTRSGKIMRRLLRALALNSPLGDVSMLEDETSAEEARKVFEEFKSEVWRSVKQFVRKPLVVPPSITLKSSPRSSSPRSSQWLAATAGASRALSRRGTSSGRWLAAQTPQHRWER
uniref:AMP-binding enzyme C-terminal domain-containing protein n=1 Tax=Thermofilum pendens TaxID=2269 RepID=A0A7C3WUZ8_THEPE